VWNAGDGHPEPCTDKLAHNIVTPRAVGNEDEIHQHYTPTSYTDHAPIWYTLLNFWP